MFVPPQSPAPASSPSYLPSRNASAPVSAPQTRNPITIRLRKILGTNFTDEATSEALRTLSELYGTQSPIPASCSKEPTTDDTDSDDDWDDENANAGPAAEDRREGSNETTSRARKNLHRDLENKLAQGSQQFLAAFSQVDQVRVGLIRRQELCRLTPL